MQVNAETLQAKIERWEGLKFLYGELSLNEEYQLEAYKMLLGYMCSCHCDCTVNDSRRECLYCGKLL